MIEICNIRNGHPTEAYDFYIDRRSPVGNPFPMKKEAQRDIVCDAYEEHFARMVKLGNHEFVGYLTTMSKALAIHGKVRLFCWCAPKRCHGEMIKQYLESNTPSHSKSV